MGDGERMIRVRKEDLRLGMYIQSLEGSWFNHPFWKNKFLLEEMDDLRALQSGDIESVWVDEEKSLAPALTHLGIQQAVRESNVRRRHVEAPVAAPVNRRDHHVAAPFDQPNPCRQS